MFEASHWQTILFPGNTVDSRSETVFTVDMTKTEAQEALWQAILLFKFFQLMGA